MTGVPGVTQSLQAAQPNLFVLPRCRYMLPVGAGCGGPGSRACSTGQQCMPGQLAGGCCSPGSECTYGAATSLDALHRIISTIRAQPASCASLVLKAQMQALDEEA